MVKHQTTVVFFDDNVGNRALIQECCMALHQAERSVVVASGAELFNLLTGQCEQAGATALIVLTVNGAPKTAENILLQLREDERLRHIPVVLMAKGNRFQDRFFRLGADGFYIKPPLYPLLLQQVAWFFQLTYVGWGNASVAAATWMIKH